MLYAKNSPDYTKKEYHRYVSVGPFLRSPAHFLARDPARTLALCPLCVLDLHLVSIRPCLPAHTSQAPTHARTGPLRV